MPFKSSFPDLDLPQTDILTYLFSGHDVSDEPLWIDSVQPDKCLSAKQALEWIKRLGLGLSRLGLNKGDVVFVLTPNHILVPPAYLGIVGAGCVFTSANPAYTADEVAFQLSNSLAKVVLVHPKLLDRALEACKKIGFPNERLFQFSDAVNPTRNGIEDWSRLLASRQESQAWKWAVLTAVESRQTVAVVNYSSGTTGLPKGVCLSHANLIANLEQIIFMDCLDTPRDERGQLPHERWIAFLPLYHAYGQTFMILKALKLNRSVFVMAEFALDKYLDIASRHRVRRLHVVPPVVVMLSKRPETAKYDLSSVKEILCGAAPLSDQLQTDVENKLGVRIRQAWGMTEATTAVTYQTPRVLARGGGSVGRLVPNCEVKLLDDNGQEVGNDAPGEAFVRGPHVCLGYWRNEAATSETLVDGWLKTGDVLVRNADGDFWVVDRKKELIKVNGFQVSPAELEAVLLENDDVADAAVVGITLSGNELPRAYVVLQPRSRDKVKPADVQKWTASRVAKHKRLAGGVVFIDEVPKLASGKIQRKVMREWARMDADKMEKNQDAKAVAKL